MSVKSKNHHHGRLHILTRDEIQDIFNLPNFTDEERLLYFALTETELIILNQSRSLASKLNFILQLGYFKSRRLFFAFEISDVSDDAEFIHRKYFTDESPEIPTSPKIAVNTSLKHRRTIAELHNYQFCGRKERKTIEQVAKNAAKISGKPIWTNRRERAINPYKKLFTNVIDVIIRIDLVTFEMPIRSNAIFQLTLS